MSCRAIRVYKAGGPEVLTLENISIPDPGPGEVVIQQHAIGVNFIDIYHRTDLYPIERPCGLGMEAAGQIIATGPDVAPDFSLGDRVVYASAPPGAYADMRLLPAKNLIKLPPDINDEQAAAITLKGMTAEYLIRRTYPVKAGDIVLFHAAAGGVGLLACQWLKQLGATVIGTVSTPEKEKVALAHGCHHVLCHQQNSINADIQDITNGTGVDVVFDGIGATTFDISLNSLKTRGTLVSFGNASGPVTNFNLGELATKGSLYITRPILKDYTRTRQELEQSANILFQAVNQGIKIVIGQRFDLADVAIAHQALEKRQTTGSTILTTACFT